MYQKQGKIYAASKKSVKESLKSVNKHIRVSTGCAQKFQPARKFSQVA